MVKSQFEQTLFKVYPNPTWQGFIAGVHKVRTSFQNPDSQRVPSGPQVGADKSGKRGLWTPEQKV